MTINNLTNAIFNLTSPAIVMKNAIFPSIEHSSALVRNAGITLLLTMVKKVSNFLKIFEKSLSQLELNKFSNFVSDYVIKVSINLVFA